MDRFGLTGGLGESPMTSLAINLGEAKLDSSRRRSPGKSRNNSGRLGLGRSSANLPKALVRPAFDENVNNRASTASPLQFDLSPAQLRVVPMRSLVSPVPSSFNESESESISSLSSSSRSSSASEMSFESSGHQEDEVVARLTGAPPPLPAHAPGKSSNGPSGRRYMSMSANIFLGRKSPIDQDVATPVKKPSPVKKNLFSAIGEEEEEEEEEVDEEMAEEADATPTVEVGDFFSY